MLYCANIQTHRDNNTHQQNHIADNRFHELGLRKNKAIPSIL
jgi:hypothetical protein